jgi:uncharacterized membrane protein YgdD (TMEM256/DUF423 family)
MSNSLQHSRLAFILAGVLGMIGVGLGALGAHGLKATLLARGTVAAFESGARYHMFHVLAIFVAGLWLQSAASSAPTLGKWAVRCWAIGIVLFSGSLYWLSLGGPRWLGPVTPFGGVAFILGWALVLIAGVTKQPSAREAR